MSLLEISEFTNVGERRWGVSLIDDEGVTVLRNVTPLAKGVALATAKALRYKGPDAPFLGDEPGTPTIPSWAAEKTAHGWLLRLTLITETLFDLLLKQEDNAEDTKIIENALEVVKSNLTKAEIKWNPPDADPAYEQKESDETVTQGHPGS